MTRARIVRIVPLLMKLILLAGIVALATWSAGGAA
jgi:hypothetical protein